MIRDNADNPIPTYIGAIAPGAATTCSVRIDCEENRTLSAEASPAFVVDARKAGDTDWTDIEATPIDLTPYAPNRETFEIRITADDAIEGRNGFAVRVGP